jgi:hypothetical protein
MEKSEGQQMLLSTKINELSLKIIGSHIEPLLEQLYEEMESAAISFRPKAYLSDGWGCPNKARALTFPSNVARSWNRNSRRRNHHSSNA